MSQTSRANTGEQSPTTHRRAALQFANGMMWSAVGDLADAAMQSEPLDVDDLVECIDVARDTLKLARVRLLACANDTRPGVCNTDEQQCEWPRCRPCRNRTPRG